MPISMRRRRRLIARWNESNGQLPYEIGCFAGSGRVKRWRMRLPPLLLKAAFAAAFVVALTLAATAQQPPPKTPLPLQPLAQQVRRLETALRYLGEPLPPEDRQAIDLAIGSTDEAAAVLRL